jgi:hypothetical protein
VEELQKRGLDKKTVFFSDYHIGYWLLHQYPLTKSTTHPSNIARPFLFKYYGNRNTTSLEELKDIMEKQKPEIIVSRFNYLGHFYVGSEENEYFAKQIASDFKLIVGDTVKRIFIWQRNL